MLVWKLCQHILSSFLKASGNPKKTHILKKLRLYPWYDLNETEYDIYEGLGLGT